MEKRRVCISISGIVQGVFFRYSARIKAEELNLKGWVRNRQDGRVEAVFEGESGDIEKIIIWCRQGPSEARVKDITVDEQEYREEFDSFLII